MTVKGTGFYGTSTGVYVSAAKASTWTPGTVPPMSDRSVFVGTQYVPAKAIPNAPMVPLKDGAFEVTVTIPAGTIQDGEPWQVCREDLLASVYDWPLRVVADEVSGAPVVVPVRRARRGYEACSPA